MYFRLRCFKTQHLTHVFVCRPISQSFDPFYLVNLLRVYFGLEVYIVTEKSPQIKLILHSNIGLRVKLSQHGFY